MTFGHSSKALFRPLSQGDSFERVSGERDNLSFYILVFRSLSFMYRQMISRSSSPYFSMLTLPR